MFDGTLGQWRGPNFKIELKEGVKPYYSRPYSVPKIHEETTKKECARMGKISILRKSTGSEWEAPTFIIPKKHNTVRLISDFKELKKRIKRKPYPIPKIQDLLLMLEGFKYATSLDLNMVYYHIQLDLAYRKLCAKLPSVYNHDSKLFLASGNCEKDKNMRSLIDYIIVKTLQEDVGSIRSLLVMDNTDGTKNLVSGDYQGRIKIWNLGDFNVSKLSMHIEAPRILSM